MQMARVRFPDDASAVPFYSPPKLSRIGASLTGARCQCSLAVERLLRKQKVAGSIPVVGSSFDFRDYVCVGGILRRSRRIRQCSLAVEHPLSKREVVGSNPAIGLFVYHEVFAGM
jgi:hypothetical protein